MPETPFVTRFMKYMGMNAKEMTKEWRELSEEDKRQLREGFENNSMTY